MLIPGEIDYSKYNSLSGMSTKQWGKAGWDFLFICILGQYPIKINLSVKNDRNIQRSFKNLFTNLSFLLPCVFCRDSYKQFLKELPINKYLVGRIELMYWLYLLKDKVNTKLLNQEKSCYNNKKKKLKVLFKNKQITKETYYLKINKYKKKIFTTKISPPFKEVLDKYENFRAVCHTSSKKCT